MNSNVGSFTTLKAAINLMNFRVLVHLFLVYILQTIDRLASHLQNHLPREAKVKIQNIAIEYVKCQVCILINTSYPPLSFYFNRI